MALLMDGQSRPLFTFGTLMDSDLLRLVGGVEIASLNPQAAEIEGFERRWVMDDDYPVLVVRRGVCTAGLLIDDPDPTTLSRMEFFEGEEFSLQNITVRRLSDGAAVNARYFADQHRKPVSDRVWTLAEWQRDTKAAMLPRASRYMQCYGRMSRAEADQYW